MQIFHRRFSIVPPMRSGQRKKIVMFGSGANKRIGQVQNKKYSADIDGLIQLFNMKLPADWRPVGHPMKVSLMLVKPYRKSEPKKNKTGLIPMNVTPDLDNLIKMYFDAMTRSGIIEDDKYITSADISKWWGENPRIEMKVELLTHEGVIWFRS